MTNLDTDPTLLRFCNAREDIIKAFAESVQRGERQVDTHYINGETAIGVPVLKTWDRAMKGSVPPIILDWVLDLYPDMNREWLTEPDLEAFKARGKATQEARVRWFEAIELFSKHRKVLEDTARVFYRELDFSQKTECPLQGLRLLTRPGWIRTTPLELREDTEIRHLYPLGLGRSFQPQKLQGLTGDYISYKGSLTYKNRRKAKPEPQHNGEIFCVADIQYENGEFIGFRYDLAHYFDYVNTCEILGAELADWLLEQRTPTPDLRTLPYRGVPEAAFDFSNRACYPGINCLTVFMNYSESESRRRRNLFLLHKRDETQLQAQNTVHVLPAGGHQGFSKGAQREDAAIWRTVVREFFEELFNKEQLYRQPESWDDFLDLPEVRELARGFFGSDKPAARIFLHGFGLDPVTLKPEVLVTIIVDWAVVRSRFANAKLVYNWEIRNKDQSRHQWADLSEAELRRQAAGLCQSIGDVFLETLPAGAACMIATATHFDKLGLPRSCENV